MEWNDVEHAIRLIHTFTRNDIEIEDSIEIKSEMEFTKNYWISIILRLPCISLCSVNFFYYVHIKALINWCHLQCYLNGLQSTIVVVCVFFYSILPHRHIHWHCSCALNDKFDFLSHTVFFIFISIEQAGVAEINDTSMFENIWNSWNNNFLLSRGGEEKFNSVVNGNCCCKRRRRGGF